jgi:hypothetical protein
MNNILVNNIERLNEFNTVIKIATTNGYSDEIIHLNRTKNKNSLHQMGKKDKWILFT